MSPKVSVREHLLLTTNSAKWVLLAIPLGILVGTSCAAFLWLLDFVTNVRFQHPWLLWFLPVAGAAVGWMYLRFGKSVECGNNLIIDEIHSPGGGVPLRMAPLVFIGTIVTHLFGGSVGREGTAVQMGGSIAGELARRIPRLGREQVSILLMTGIAAGFAGVFGTPVAGMIFAMEVLVIGRMNYSALLPCLLAAIASDQTCLAWGIDHTHYHVASMLPAGSLSQVAAFDGRLMAITVVAGIVFGLTSLLFSQMAHGVAWLFKRYVQWPILRPVLGGLLIIVLVQCVGTSDFLGLGVSSPDKTAVTIVSTFQPGGAHAWSWLWKLVFTVIALGGGFKGGEVTPLFFIGSALGHSLAVLFGAPVDLMAALGFVSVFAGATNTPLACTVMAVELFGGEYLYYFATSCVLAFLFSGHSGIYTSQRMGTHKSGSAIAIDRATRRNQDKLDF